MPAERKSRRPLHQYTIAVVFFKELELTAFRYMLDEEHDTSGLQRKHDDSHEFFLGRVGDHLLTLVLSGEQGMKGARDAATHLSSTFEPIQFHLLVGIGGGDPNAERKTRLGDVVISMPAKQDAVMGQYNDGRDTNERFKEALRAPPEYVRNAVAKICSDRGVEKNNIDVFVEQMLTRNTRLRRRYQHPHTSRSKSCNQCRQPQGTTGALRDPSAPVTIHCDNHNVSREAGFSNKSRTNTAGKFNVTVQT